MLPKSIVLWGRVLRRTALASARVRGMRIYILAVGALLALFGIISKPDLQKWLLADRWHLAIAITGAILLLAFLGLYDAEKELSGFNVLLVKPLGVGEAEVKGTLRIGGGEAANDVLALRFRIEIRNDSEKIYRAYFPAIILSRRRGRVQDWETVPIKVLDVSARAQSKGVPRTGPLWSEQRRLDIASRDEMHVGFGVFATSPEEGGEAFLNVEMKLRLNIELLGHSALHCEIPVPRISART